MCNWLIIIILTLLSLGLNAQTLDDPALIPTLEYILHDNYQQGVTHYTIDLNGNDGGKKFNYHVTVIQTNDSTITYRWKEDDKMFKKKVSVDSSGFSELQNGLDTLKTQPPIHESTENKERFQLIQKRDSLGRLVLESVNDLELFLPPHKTTFEYDEFGGVRAEDFVYLNNEWKSLKRTYRNKSITQTNNVKTVVSEQQINITNFPYSEFAMNYSYYKHQTNEHRDSIGRLTIIEHESWDFRRYKYPEGPFKFDPMTQPTCSFSFRIVYQ